MRLRSAVVVGVLSLTVSSTSALARSAGITGSSGLTGTTCTRCHAEGATKPTVEFSGPTTVTPGSVNQYAFIIRGGPAAVGGTNLAVSGTADLLGFVDASLKKSGTELIHSAAKAFDTTGTTPELRFAFSLTAPATEGTLTLYGAGNSANNDKGRGGDGVAATTLAVTVLAPPAPDAGTEPDSGTTPDAGMEPDSGTTPDAGTTPDSGTGTDAGTGGEPGGGGNPGSGGEDEGGGCSSTGGAPMLLVALSVAGLIRLRRRRA